MNGSIQIYCGNALLADGTSANGRCESLQFNGEEIVQNCPYIDAQFLEFLDRGNQSTAIPFQVYTQFDDQVDALGYAAELRASIAGVIDLTIVLTLAGGKSVTIYCPSAKWDKVQSTAAAGVSVAAKFSVTAGAVIVTYDGSGATPLPIPYEPDSQINPLVIPAGFSASLNSGEDGFYFGAEISGTLTVNTGAHAFALAA